MAHKTYQYCVAENWGKGFITQNDSIKLEPMGLPGDVWRVPAHNQDANRWISGVAGTHKTLSEAQAIVDAIITQRQADWDALPADQKAPTPGFDDITRPENIVLEE
jgi:hypothetical protein|tara:strand:+ start:786 stop:1103 length:318 start_codon:yes stop_codon:yes gene_type:complete